MANACGVNWSAKREALPRRTDPLTYAVAARESVTGKGILAITAADVF
jgi:hypothetical protein